MPSSRRPYHRQPALHVTIVAVSVQTLDALEA